MAATAKLADYVIAPKICLEREDVTLLTDIWYDKAYSQYTKTVVEAEGDQIEEWELFWELGKRMGLTLELPNGPIDMANKPTKFDLLANITGGSRVPLAEIASHDGGKVYPDLDVIIGPADPETKGHLDLYPTGLDAELNAAFADLQTEDSEWNYLLISRRMKNTYNSTGPELSLLKGKGTTNPAFIHPNDLEALGIADGEIIEISSRHGAIPAVAAASDAVRSGVVSMSHCWGGSPADAKTAPQVREIGSNTNRLVDNLWQTEKYSGMPRQSSIPVAIRKV